MDRWCQGRILDELLKTPMRRVNTTIECAACFTPCYPCRYGAHHVAWTEGAGLGECAWCPADGCPAESTCSRLYIALLVECPSRHTSKRSRPSQMPLSGRQSDLDDLNHLNKMTLWLNTSGSRSPKPVTKRPRCALYISSIELMGLVGH